MTRSLHHPSGGGRSAHENKHRRPTAFTAGPTIEGRADIQNFGGTHFPRRMSFPDAPVQPSKQPGRVIVIALCPKPYAEFAHTGETSVRIKSSAVEV